MKSSLRKLRGFSLGKHGAKERLDGVYYGQKQQQPLAQLDELVQSSQDIQEMLECYEGLMLTSARAANSVFEFSEALQDVATCLLEKTASNIDEDSGRVLLMLGKVQYDLHKLLDRYRAHIAQTITTPSESLLSELKIVEEMKEQCEEKRKAYELIRAEGVKGKSKTSKGETVSSQPLQSALQSAKEDYDQQATLLVCRLMSLKQGKPRSLLTQAARHYTAQLHLFRKGLACLEALEPHVKQIAEQFHIDYQLGELEEDDGEISFEFSQNDHEYDESTSSENSMQLDRSDPSPPGSLVYVEPSQSQANPEKVEEYGLVTARRSMVGSKSAPLIPSSYGKSDGIEKVPDMQPSMATQRNLPTYALPIPGGAKSGNITGVSNGTIGTRPVVGSGAVSSSWHTSPLEQFKRPNTGLEVAATKNDSNLRESGEISRSGHLLRNSHISRAHPLPEEPNLTSSAPPPLRFDTPDASDPKRIKRYAYSGPLTGKSWSSRPILHGSGPLASRQVEPSFKSGPLGRSSISHAFGSSKISPSVSPPNLSPPHTNKFYELPKPPPIDSTKPLRSSNMITHSAPLVAKKNHELLVAQKPGPTTLKPASPLPPPPPGLVTRSFSIPSSSQKGKISHLPKISEASERIQITEEAASPPLTPIPFPTSKGKFSSTGISDGTGQSSEVRSGPAVQLHGSSASSTLG